MLSVLLVAPGRSADARPSGAEPEPRFFAVGYLVVSVALVAVYTLVSYSQPSAPISAQNLTKFQANPQYFLPVYANTIFTVYVVVGNPCLAPGAPVCINV